MPISSLIVKTKINETSNIIEKLNKMQEAEVAEIREDNIILVTDTRTRRDDKVLWETIENLPGVINCDLIFHNFEDEEEFSHERK